LISVFSQERRGKPQSAGASIWSRLIKIGDSQSSLIHGIFSGPFDLIVDATGALTLDGVGPEKSLKSLEGDTNGSHRASPAQ
jgi:hypothetical protein